MQNVTEKKVSRESVHAREDNRPENDDQTEKDTTVDIVIVTYQSEETIIATLQSVLALEGVELQCSIIDNSPRKENNQLSETQKVVQNHYPSIPVYVPEKNLGFGAACNLGAHMMHSSYIFFLNPDAYFLDTTTLASMLHDFRRVLQLTHTQDLIMGPRIITDDQEYPTGRAFPSLFTGTLHAIRSLLRGHNNSFSRLTDQYLNPVQRHISSNLIEVDWVSGAAFLIQRSSWERLSGFDEDYFMYAEDMDLCWRLRQHGGYVVKSLAHKIAHVGGVSTTKRKKDAQKWHHDSLYLFLSKTLSGKKRMFLPYIRKSLSARCAFVTRHDT